MVQNPPYLMEIAAKLSGRERRHDELQMRFEGIGTFAKHPHLT
jgi:hypothetical protein